MSGREGGHADVTQSDRCLVLVVQWETSEEEKLLRIRWEMRI